MKKSNKFIIDLSKFLCQEKDSTKNLNKSLDIYIREVTPDNLSIFFCVNLAQFLGFKESPPPFLYLLRKDKKNFMRNVLNGANFASGGAGLLGITGKRPYVRNHRKLFLLINIGMSFFFFVCNICLKCLRAIQKRVISVAEQVQQFAKVRNAYTKLLGNQAEDRLSKSLFLISVGSNDIFEYFLYNQTQIKSENFISTLLYSYEYHLRVRIYIFSLYMYVYILSFFLFL